MRIACGISVKKKVPSAERPEQAPEQAPGASRSVQYGLIVMLPRSELAEMVCGDASSQGTVTVFAPTKVCSSTLYEAVFGTLMLIGPTFVDARTEAGTDV